MARYCKNKQTCAKCGDEHEQKKCVAVEPKCGNCTRSNLMNKTNFDVKHQMNDRRCSVHERELIRQQNNVNYGYK